MREYKFHCVDKIRYLACLLAALISLVVLLLEEFFSSAEKDILDVL